ncbi:P pilus assembly protein, chaperone PapD [Rosenbergiella nectarea]|uniref:P pilus assembly protein, chaperone PapD n=1 Tax=Rosenbergiella nectarea TaxID=988801 RepID=A0A1H9M9F2_9GAMM|nr:molecular chaperone [Rosenbergiella nectarea]SER20099.1 P pilus assembly protein, chaperone PapD [Rosenbergiella nectarea]
MFKFLLGCIVFLLAMQSSRAGMSIVGTRIIYPGNEKEITVRTKNRTDQPILSQVWVDDGSSNEDIDKSKIPFIVTPPIFRVEPNSGQSLKLIYNGMSLPQDKESVFWFNLLEIPPVDTSNAQQKLNIAFRTRIKIFYRPAAVAKIKMPDITTLLHWSVIKDSAHGTGFRVENTGPFYFSFNDAIVFVNNKQVNMKMSMLAPRSSAVFFPDQRVTSFSRLKYSFINDLGVNVENDLIWSQINGLQSQ